MSRMSAVPAHRPINGSRVEDERARLFRRPANGRSHKLRTGTHDPILPLARLAVEIGVRPEQLFVCGQALHAMRPALYDLSSWIRFFTRETYLALRRAHWRRSHRRLSRKTRKQGFLPLLCLLRWIESVPAEDGAKDIAARVICHKDLAG